MNVAASLLALSLFGQLDAGQSQAIAMQNALKAVLHLAPALSSDAAFKVAVGTPALKSDLDALMQVEHGFRAGGSTDPGARSIASVLSAQIARARAQLSNGDVENARAQLRGLTTLCFTCHTLSATVDFERPLRTPSVALTSFERASLLAATRHFDDAIDLWLIALRRAPKTFEESTDQMNALRQAIAVTVSVKDNPIKTLELLDARVGGDINAPYASGWTTAWRTATAAWALERFDVRAKTPQQLFTRAKALVEQSHAAEHILSDETHTIGLLRATAYLTQALTREPHARWRSEALFALGVATATVREAMVWGLDGVYFEACIRENPGTPIAQRCFSLLMERTLFGFTGSAGTHLPRDVDDRLRDLAKLAGVAGPVKP